MEFPVGEFSSSSSPSVGSNRSLWSRIRPGRPAAEGGPSPPLDAAATNGENGFLSAGFPPHPVIHAFSIRTRLGTRLRVCGEQLADCWARLTGRQPRRVYGTQAEMYASATAPLRDHQAESEGAMSGGPAAGDVSNSSSDSPPYMPAEEGTGSSYRHHRQPAPPSSRGFRDLAV